MSAFGAPGGGAKSQVRPGGGFRQSFGSFSDEHENANAQSAAAAQKQAAQQSSVLGQQGVAKQQAAASGAGQSPFAPGGAGEKNAPGVSQAPPPRNVSNLGEELFIRPAKDVFNTFKSIFDLNAILGINPGDTPEKKAKKQKIAQNLQKLTQEEQAFVQQEFQRAQQKKQQEQQEEQARKEEEARAKEQDAIAPPSSPKKGPAAPGGSKKSQTAQLMQNKRTQMSQADG